MRNFSVEHLGTFDGWERHVYQHPRFKRAIPGRIFLKKLVGLTGMEVSLSKLPPGVAVPFYHAHKENEELYLILRGRGQFQVDGETFDVREGSVVRIAPKGVRTWRNNGTEPMLIACVQCREGSLTSDEIADGIPLEQPVTWP